MKLEELARQSSDAARVSVAHLDAPPLGERSPNRSWMPVLAGAALVVLVVGGLYALLRDRTGDTTIDPADTALPTVTGVPRLGLPDLDGWTVTFAGDLGDLDGAEQQQPTFTYYGDAESDDPFADGDLLIAAFVGSRPDSGPTPPRDGDTIELRGTTAAITTGLDVGLPGTTAIEWNEIDEAGDLAEIVVASRSLGVDELTAIAEALTIDPATGAVTPADDLGLDRLLTSAGTPFDAMRGAREGFLVGYERGEQSDFLVLGTTLGDLERDATVLQWWTADITATTINGRPGYVATFDAQMADLGPTVAWSPVDGVVATLNHIGADDSLDLAALAATATEIDDATWASYLAASESATMTGDDFDEIYGEGDGELDGTRYSWTLGLQGTNLCFEIRSQNDGIGSCQERSGVAAPPGTARSVDNGFGPTIGQVLLVADPAVEQIVEVDGRWTVERVDADGVAWFVAIGDASIQPEFDVIVGGEVVDTVEAASEAIAEAVVVDELLDGLSIAVADTTDPDFQWWLGRNGPDLCVVTGGLTASASCSPPTDVTALGPVESPAGELSFVVLQDVPSCVDAIGLDGATVDVVVQGSDDEHRYDVVVAFGRPDGWQVRFDVAGSATFVDLPEAGGPTSWPPLLCDG